MKVVPGQILWVLVGRQLASTLWLAVGTPAPERMCVT